MATARSCAPCRSRSRWATDDEVREVSAITHTHATSCGACATAVRLARLLIDGGDPFDATRAVGLDGWADAPESSVRSGGYVLDTLHAAVWCLLNTGSHRDCALAAVNLGADTDTTAAVAGALAGIAYGADSIPRVWIGALRGKDVIDACLF